MTKNLPAKRYDLFIKAFEKEVEKAQAKIKAMDALMRPYEICRVALEAAKLENETELELQDTGIRIRIVPLQNDRKGFYDTLLQAIGKELKRVDLHRSGEWATGTTSYDFFHLWHLTMSNNDNGRPPRIEVRLDVPIQGTDYIKIIEGPSRIQTYTDVARKPVWIDKVEQNKVTELGGSADDIPF